MPMRRHVPVSGTAYDAQGTRSRLTHMSRRFFQALCVDPDNPGAAAERMVTVAAVLILGAVLCWLMVLGALSVADLIDHADRR